MFNSTCKSRPVIRIKFNILGASFYCVASLMPTRARDAGYYRFFPIEDDCQTGTDPELHVYWE